MAMVKVTTVVTRIVTVFGAHSELVLWYGDFII